MLRRAKSFMVKKQPTAEEKDEDETELSETAHLRRKFVPVIATQPIYECIPQHRNKPETTKPQVQQQNTTTTAAAARKGSFRGLRRQISISVDNMMKNGLFNLRSTATATRRQDKSDGVKSFRNTVAVSENKPVFEVQHNNASRLRMMSQINKKSTK